MHVLGNYTLSSFFSKAEGPFTVILKNVFVKGNASLTVERDGKIRTQDINMDITFSDMTMNFENLGKSWKINLENCIRYILKYFQDSWEVYFSLLLIRRQI